ncbi:hypothetical protein [Leifsonia shinshuensis]|uniref:Uncharacterized protein n=1 Tax=Leifsonia shinshuensis TaxID=150026 RepID=A0A853CS96_9MICO|nr:hypothetical protein [Leifsonia shinshuensis]NYJ23836.1 hypothetical protein [Leifsonia shinshuensis]
MSAYAAAGVSGEDLDVVVGIERPDGATVAEHLTPAQAVALAQDLVRIASDTLALQAIIGDL